MKLLIFVLNKTEKLDELLVELSNSGLKGATILNSVGMATSIYNSNKEKETTNPIINSLKILFGDLNNESNNENKTIFTVVDDKQEEIFYKTVKKIVGPLSKENTGIIFTLPITSIYGISTEEKVDKFNI